jgi:hypothetical protein
MCVIGGKKCQGFRVFTIHCLGNPLPISLLPSISCQLAAFKTITEAEKSVERETESNETDPGEQNLSEENGGPTPQVEG